MADRRPKDLELGREAPAHSRRTRLGGGPVPHARYKTTRAEPACFARAENRGCRSLVHDGFALVIAVQLRADRDRYLSSRESEGRVQAVRCRRSDRKSTR